jgi:signal transduction histidine kinase/CheY-like chemotaxis protein
LIDHQYQFVAVEMTRTHSLTEKRSAPNEHIFLGVAKLDACVGVCPVTMKAFLDETGEWVRTGPNVIANRTRYIINDFTIEPGYTDRPYVVNYPYFRSYLEVPLVSPLGYLLGSYCVVDNKPNDYDNDEKVGIMNEISSAIMAHLELRRIEQSRDRSEQLVRGLSGFINYEPTAPHPSHTPSQPNTNNSSNTAQSMDRSMTEISSLMEQGQPVGAPAGSVSGSGSWVNIKVDGSSWNQVSSDTDLDRATDPRPSLDHASSSLESCRTVSSTVGKDSSETPPTTPRDEVGENPLDRPDIPENTAESANQPAGLVTTGPGDMELRPNGFISSANIKSTLFRAALTIRQSMNMDGFMFLDAVPSAYTDRSDQLSPDDTGDISREGVVGPFCPAIVQSYLGQMGESVSQSSQTRLPEAVLQRFIRRFPQGHIFSADEFGPIDETYAPGKPWPGLRMTESDNLRFRKDVATLFRGVPAAKYIIFLPLWHFQQECWYAAALGWVADPTRGVDVADLSLIATFGNTVMAEVSRLEALATSRAKSDFVSSISHELRSPLHGIMAGSELLREAISDPALLSTLDMLDSCGTTLLDIFNNLLQHAIVTSSGGRYRTTMADVRFTDLGGLVEDVMDVVHASHLSENAFKSSEHRKGSYALGLSGPGEEQRHRPLLVSLTIEESPTWKLPVNTGAWKRIVMNIFGNALKYTTCGRIQVNLKQVQRPDKSGSLRDYISFSVEDTGLGMSSDYLKYKLFMPFSQENPHYTGMGLGLNIVQQLATGLGGTVDVRSSVGIGTFIEVLIPLEREIAESIPLQAAIEHDRPPFDDQKRRLSGRRVCLITPDAYVAMASPSQSLEVTDSMRKRSAIVEEALRVIAGAALGMNIIHGTTDCPSPVADVYVLDCDVVNNFPADITGSILRAKLSTVRPIILLCAGSGPPSCSKQEALKDRVFHSLHHPLGPRKVALVFCLALDASPQYPVQESPPLERKTAPTGPDTGVISTSPISLRPCLKEHDAVPIQSQKQPLSELGPSPPQPVTTQIRTYHLLLVDDNPINIKLLAAVTRKLKHTFATACNGLEAVQLYKDALETQRPFNLIFMDISMPVMDGFQATREIRQIESEAKATRCKIVALTGLSSESSRNEAFVNGSDLFITKPVKLGMVKQLLAEELDTTVDVN